MTVLTQNPPLSQYTGDGITTFFAYGFAIIDESAILVVVNGAQVTYVREATGVTITPAPPIGALISILRETAVTQETHFTAQEAFHGEKTEDAMDKLILLKQEAFTTNADIYASHALDRVTIVCSAGTDAPIFIWDTDEAGVFAGEASQTIPDAGDVVAKPKDFAYFQWGNPAQFMVLTTTLYPAEARDGLRFSASISFASMSPIPMEAEDVSYSLMSGTLIALLVQLPPSLESEDVFYSLMSGTLDTILKAVPPKFEAEDLVYTARDGTLKAVLITVYTHPDGLLFSCSLNAAGCTMTPA